MMNFGALDVQSVQQSRPQLQRVQESDIPMTHVVEYEEPENPFLDDQDTPSLTSSSNSNNSEVETVIRWQTPPSRVRSPRRSPTQLRHESHLQTRHEHPAVQQYHSYNPTVVQFDEEQIQSIEAEASKRAVMEDDNDLDRSPNATPSNDDTTPYIRFAIDQLTRDNEVAVAHRPSTSTSSDSYPVERVLPDLGLGYMRSPLTREELALARKHRSTPSGESGRLFRYNPTRPLTPPHEGRPAEETQQPVLLGINNSEIFIPVETPHKTPRYPDLKFIPMILRPLSMIILSILCLLMAAALAFCAIYSSYHGGLLEFADGIHGARYFLFGFVPQILAACIFIYIQCVVATVTRIMPYTMMAMDDVESRANALFLDVFPRSMLWPKWDGQTSIDIANTLLWLTVFTIPLQGCLFSVVLVDGIWLWYPVQGVAWTLFALYLLAFIGVVIVGIFFYDRTTGLMWDPRSLADVAALLPRSNCLKDYPGTDVMKSRREIRNQLLLRSDRLGYWRTPKATQGLFYCLGETGAPIRRYTLESGKIQEKPSGKFEVAEDIEADRADLYSAYTRFRYIPWYLEDNFVILWPLGSFIILLALFVVSFLPITAISKGFAPLISVLPDSDGYSPANFVYSFIPSLLGMFLYLLFQPIDMAIRKLQPWAELANPEGATADQSLLLDYPSALPFECTFTAIQGRHYRVAFLSLASFIFILLPILAGGIFFPLTTPSGVVRMIPNLPSYYICLALLIIYLISLLTLIPSRHRLHLPHDISCLAEIISFLHGSHILDDAAFRAPRTKPDLETRLMALHAHAGGPVARYAFGVHKGRQGHECLGVERLGRRGSQEVMVLSGF